MSKSKLFILGIATLLILLVSCHKGRNKLVNSWKVSAVEVKTNVSDSIKNLILDNGTLTFTKEGLVTGYLQRKINKGIFILSDGGKKLVIKDDIGSPYPFESTITNDQLILDGKELKITFDKQ